MVVVFSSFFSERWFRQVVDDAFESTSVNPAAEVAADNGDGHSFPLDADLFADSHIKSLESFELV